MINVHFWYDWIFIISDHMIYMQRYIRSWSRRLDNYIFHAPANTLWMHLTSLLSRPSRTCDISSESLKLYKKKLVWGSFFFHNIFHTLKLIFYFGTWKGRVFKNSSKAHCRSPVAVFYVYLFLWINCQGRPHTALSNFWLI